MAASSSPRRSWQHSRSAHLLIMAILWGFIVASVLAFGLITFMRGTRYYRRTPKHTVWFAEWGLPYTLVGLEKGGTNQAMLNGLWVAQILLQWLPNVSAIIFACAMMYTSHVYTKRREEALRHGTATDDGPGVAAFDRWMDSARLEFKRVSSYQLPPRRFWSWWCGGMSGLDFFWVLVYLGLNFCWIYESFKMRFVTVDADVAKGKLSGKAATDKYVATAGDAFGWVSVVDLLMLYYPIPRSSFLNWIFKADFPTVIRYHRWMSHGFMWILLLHCLIYYGLWWNQSVWVEETFDWGMHEINNCAGTIAWWISIIMWICSINWIRRNYFEVFYRVHIFGAIFFLLFSMMHYKYLVYYMLPGLIIYMLDLSFRWWQYTVDRSYARMSLLPGGSKMFTIELAFSPVAELLPGQFVVLHFPTVSHHERHPFTIAEVHRDPVSKVQRALIHVKATGRWSRDVRMDIHMALHDDPKLGGSVLVPVTVDGPYGNSHALDRPYDAAVLVAGGIGATPVTAILQDMARRRASGLPGPNRVHLIFASKDPNDFEALLPEEVHEAAGSGDGWLDLSLHATDPQATLAHTSYTRKVLPQHELPMHVRLLQGYHHSYLAYALAGVLCFFGAFAGLLPAAGYDAHEAKTTTTGAWFSVTGIIQFCGIFLGAVLPPLLLVIIPSYFYRKRLTNQYHSDCGSSSDDSFSKEKACEGGASACEGGAAIRQSIVPGRPDLPAMLKDIQAKHAGSKEIPVIFAGPVCMCDEVRNACQDLSGGRDRPFMHFQQHTFVL